MAAHGRALKAAARVLSLAQNVVDDPGDLFGDDRSGDGFGLPAELALVEGGFLIVSEQEWAVCEFDRFWGVLDLLRPDLGRMLLYVLQVGGPVQSSARAIIEESAISHKLPYREEIAEKRFRTGRKTLCACQLLRFTFCEVRCRSNRPFLLQYYKKAYTDSKDGILMAGAVLFSAWAQIAEEGEDYALSAIQSDSVESFKQRIGRVQARAYPRLRDAYGPIAGRELRKHDMKAKTFGSGFRTIQFMGGAFAANRNKQSFQEGIVATLRQLRFRQSRYKWYEGADEYTYYEMDPPADDAVAILECPRFLYQGLR